MTFTVLSVSDENKIVLCLKDPRPLRRVPKQLFFYLLRKFPNCVYYNRYKNILNSNYDHRENLISFSSAYYMY